MASFNRPAGIRPALYLPAICLVLFLLVLPVAAADAEIEAFLGDTITISGRSVVSDRMYLFFTGPGLPENGVTLTDTSERADQGKFTILNVGSDQSWTFRWDTSRVSNAIDPGTYIVYATKDPVDKANLGGSGTYQTLEVYLKDPHISKVSISAGSSYTLNPERHSSSSDTETSPAVTPAPVTPSSLPTVTMTTADTALPTSAAPSPTRAAVLPAVPVLALFGCIALGHVMLRNRHGKRP